MTRKRFKPARAAKSAIPKRRSTPLKRDLLTDGPARFKILLWGIFVTFGYGIVNDMVLGRPESRVSVEALFVCAATLITRVALFYKRSMYLRSSPGSTERLWTRIESIQYGKFGRAVGALALALVLVANVTPAQAVESAIAAWILSKTDAGLIPGMDADLRGTPPATRFQEVSERIEQSIKQRSPGDVEQVSKVKQSLADIVQNVRLPNDVSTAAKLELAYLQSYEALSQIAAANPGILSQPAYSGGPVVIGQGMDKTTFIMTPEAPEFTITGPYPRFFSDFSVASYGHSPGLPVPQFAVTSGDNRSVVFNNIKVQGLAQDIGGLTWTNVIFVDCLIRYHGQPLMMGNVRFISCTFEPSQDAKAEALLAFLSGHQEQPVSVYTP